MARLLTFITPAGGADSCRQAQVMTRAVGTIGMGLVILSAGDGDIVSVWSIKFGNWSERKAADDKRRPMELLSIYNW